MNITDTPVDPLLRPLKRGEVGVSFYPHNTREILPESDFKLIDRPMQTGDVCKRSYDDVQSAVVANVDINFRVSHAVSGQWLDGWKKMDDVKEFDDVTVGDFVECNGWIGQIQDVRISLSALQWHSYISSSSLTSLRSKSVTTHLCASLKLVRI